MKILICRYGAYGDSIIISPVFRYLKKQGHEIYFHTSERGLQIHEHNPHIDHFVPYETDTIPLEKLAYFWNELCENIGADRFLNFTETIERRLCKIDKIPEEFNKSQDDRFLDCNKNYYEYTLEYAGIPATIENLRPELFFDKRTEKNAKKYLDWDKFNIVFCLIGSGVQKMYPWTPKIINLLYDMYPDVNCITVGDDRCRDIESIITDKCIKLSGEIHILESLAMTKYACLVVSPDTGILHASGCYKTPKIGLLGHTTIENITKHFENDYSIEAECHCAPCFRIIGDIHKHCPIDPITGANLCMGKGINPLEVLDSIQIVYQKWKDRRR